MSVKRFATSTDLHAGRSPRVTADGTTVRDLVNRFLTAKQWQKLGVEVQQLAVDLPIEERETSMSFVGRENFAEVTTAHRQWQRRLESLGCIPTSVTAFKRGSAEIRHYGMVPRRFIRMPSAGRKRIHDSAQNI